MAMTFAETFVRAYAERAMKAIEVRVDKNTGYAHLSFHGRHQQVNMRELVLQEEAFSRLGAAVDALLAITEPAIEQPSIDLVQLNPEICD